MRKLIPILVILLAISFVSGGCGGTKEATPTTTPTGMVSGTPWTDGEQTSYRIEDQKGNLVGSGKLTAKRDSDAWILKQNYTLGSANDDIAIRVRIDNLKPISEKRTISTPQGKTVITTLYGDSELAITAKTPQGDEKSATIDVPQDAYDNDEALFLWRTLPFAVGYSTSYINIVAANALKPTITLTVTGKEEIEVPAGNFNCYKLELSAAGSKQYLWYGVDPPHYLIKYDNGVTIFLLTEHS